MEAVDTENKTMQSFILLTINNNLYFTAGQHNTGVHPMHGFCCFPLFPLQDMGVGEWEREGEKEEGAGGAGIYCNMLGTA